MDIRELKQYISDNDKLPAILEKLGMHSINGNNPKYYNSVIILLCTSVHSIFFLVKITK